MLPNKLLYFRKDILRITQTEMAARIGTKQGTIGNWERRDSEPTGKLLWSLIKEFQLNPDWLFYGTGEPQFAMSSVITKDPNVISKLSLTIDLGSISVPMEQVEETLTELKRLTSEIESLKLQFNK